MDENYSRSDCTIGNLFGWFNDNINYLPKKVIEKVYCNGQRLKSGEQRLKPFYVKFIDNNALPMYNLIMQKQIFRRMIYGAYSRKHDKVRKKLKQRRKWRLF